MTAMSPTQMDVMVTGMFTEYEQLKREQQNRMTQRDNLVYTTLAALAAVGAAVVSTHQQALLLALPPVCVLLGWIYTANDHKVTAIGNYIRDSLAPRLAELSGAPVVFGWETEHRADLWRRPRKIMQLGVDLLLFAIAPFATLIVWWATTSSYSLAPVAVVEHLLLVVLVVFIAGPADLHTRARDPR